MIRGQQSVIRGQGQRTEIRGERLIVRGQQSVIKGQRSVIRSQRSYSESSGQQSHPWEPAQMWLHQQSAPPVCSLQHQPGQYCLAGTKAPHSRVGPIHKVIRSRFNKEPILNPVLNEKLQHEILLTLTLNTNWSRKTS